jgi:hypothetical protein
MTSQNKPLLVPIPLDLADALEVDRSFLSHVNAGRKHLSPPKACKVMEISLTDPRLTGIHYFHLRPHSPDEKKWMRQPMNPRKGRRG